MEARIFLWTLPVCTHNNRKNKEEFVCIATENKEEFVRIATAENKEDRKDYTAANYHCRNYQLHISFIIAGEEKYQ
jgi:hypothetical protein